MVRNSEKEGVNWVMFLRFYKEKISKISKFG